MKKSIKNILYLFAALMLVVAVSFNYEAISELNPLMKCGLALASLNLIPQAFSLGAICVSDCAVTVPPSGFDQCDTPVKKGGIIRAMFKACDLTFTLLTDTAEWTTHIGADAVHSTGRILGSKSKPTFTKKKIDSMAPEVITGGTNVVTFKDFNVSTLSHTFYNTLNQSPAKFHFGYYTANGEFFGWFTEMSVEAGLVHEEDSETGSEYWDVTVTYYGVSQPAPTAIAALETVLTA